MSIWTRGRSWSERARRRIVRSLTGRPGETHRLAIDAPRVERAVGPVSGTELSGKPPSARPPARRPLLGPDDTTIKNTKVIDDLWIPETPFVLPITYRIVNGSPVAMMSAPGLFDGAEDHLLQVTIGREGLRRGLTTAKLDSFCEPRNLQDPQWPSIFRMPSDQERTFRLLTRAMDAACRGLRREQPGVPIVLVGHSISAMLALALYCDYADKGLQPPFDALALISPTMGGIRRFAYNFVGGHENPWTIRNPLTTHYVNSGRLITKEFLDETLRNSNADARKIRIPTLVMLGRRDRDLRPAVHEFFQHIPQLYGTLRELDVDHNMEAQSPDGITCIPAAAELMEWSRDVPNLLRDTPGREPAQATQALSLEL